MKMSAETRSPSDMFSRAVDEGMTELAGDLRACRLQSIDSDRTNHPARGLTLLARLIDDLAREFFNQAIDGVIQNNPKARANPKALAQLDGYKRPLVSSLSGSSAVWDGKSCEDGIASGNYR
jgi:hypothetical protein